MFTHAQLTSSGAHTPNVKCGPPTQSTGNPLVHSRSPAARSQALLLLGCATTPQEHFGPCPITNQNTQCPSSSATHNTVHPPAPSRAHTSAGGTACDGSTRSCGCRSGGPHSSPAAHGCVLLRGCARACVRGARGCGRACGRAPLHLRCRPEQSRRTCTGKSEVQAS